MIFEADFTQLLRLKLNSSGWKILKIQEFNLPNKIRPMKIWKTCLIVPSSYPAAISFPDGDRSIVDTEAL